MLHFRRKHIVIDAQRHLNATYWVMIIITHRIPLSKSIPTQHMIIHELVLWSLEQVRVPFSIPITLEFQVQSQLLAFDLDAEEF